MVPVVDKNGKPLMPTTSANARRWIKGHRATYFYRKGVFCVRLNDDPYGYYTQRIACGIDPGSKWEAMTLKSKAHTILNIQNDATTWVKDAVETRRQMRRSRRLRKTPCRKNKSNRSTLCQKGRIPPSTRARWGTKLRLVHLFRSVIPISDYVVEDIAAVTQPGKRRWNVSFSPLEVGKNWFYDELRKLGTLVTKAGWETKALRDALGLVKSKSKKEAFEAHCVDSWVLANSVAGGHQAPENKKILFLSPLRFHRRQLHRFQPTKEVGRLAYGGTMSLGLKKGSIVEHPTYGRCYVGGNTKGRLSLHSLDTGERLTQMAKVEDCRFLSYNSWRWRVSSSP